METGRVTLATSSQTYALKGARLLSEKGIKHRVVRIRPSETRHGCSYGISVFRADRENAVRVLLSGGVRYTEVLNE